MLAVVTVIMFEFKDYFELSSLGYSEFLFIKICFGAL